MARALRVLAMLMAAALPAVPANAGAAWPVYELSPGFGYGEASLMRYPVLGGEGIGTRQSIHVAHVQPGHAYRLGLKLRSSVARKLNVSLYDRWPYAEGARPVRLSTGGGLRGREGEQEYQWWFSVDRNSPGSLLYVKVSVVPGFSSEDDGDWTYQIFIVDSPRSPMNSIGRGVAYRRGPSDLVLQERAPSVALRYVAVSEAMPIPHVDCDRRRALAPARCGTLIRNGDFSEGLRYWRLRPEGASGVGVINGRLRLWSRDSSAEAGVVQRIGTNMAGRRALRLVMDLMIEAQTEPVRSGRAPLILSICYEDTRGAIHCGNNGFRKYFSILPAGQKVRKSNVVVLPAGVWSRYSVRLDEAIPGLRTILSVDLSGAGAPEREVWVRQIRIMEK